MLTVCNNCADCTCVLFITGAGRCQHLLVKSTAEKVRVVEQHTMTKKGAEARKDLVEARLQYEAILVIKKGECCCGRCFTFPLLYAISPPAPDTDCSLYQPIIRGS